MTTTSYSRVKGNRPPPPPPPGWATEVEGRSPYFKMHTSWNHVRSAVGSSGGRGVRGGTVLEWDGSEWVVLVEIPPGTLKASHPFFLGTKGGPQDEEKETESVERRRRERVKALRSELMALEAEGSRG